MDYINTSHPNFVGGSKALEIAVQQTKSSRAALSVSRPKVYLGSNSKYALCFEMSKPINACLSFVFKFLY